MALKPGQKKCIDTLDRSIVVAAGAGSGKTFTLTKRIVNALQCGAVDDIGRVCAITFTNKAAGELKSRIKAELRACGLHDQALKVDEAWISTIHGMCARILRTHAVELDVDPVFAMADETLADELLDRAIDDVLVAAEVSCQEENISRESLDALFAEYPARSMGPWSSSVESMVRTIVGKASANARGFDALVLPKCGVNCAYLVQAALDAVESLVEATHAQKPNEAREAWAAAAQERVDATREEAQRGGCAGDPLWGLTALDALPLPKKTGTAEYKAQVAETLGMCRTCIMELRLAAASRHLETLVFLAREAARAFAASKRALGVLDNDDLLVMAHAAITGHERIAALYADKFQLVMIDEFQDTDQMQVDMIKLLAGPGACRLCTVGDAQQSIYRFRGADVSVYRRHLEEVRAQNPDSVILLPDNFRSHSDVLSLVDRVFEVPEMFGGEFMSLAPGRDESRVKRLFASDTPRIQVQLTSSPFKGGASTDDMRRVAASRIADAFARLRERGHSAGEMAVLLGGMSHADIYADALRERGMACVISGGSVFAQAPETATVLDLVCVAANPRQTQVLYNVLTGPLFELCAGDLLELATYRDAESGAFRPRNLYEGFKACVREFRKEGPRVEWSARLVLALRVLGGFVDGAGRSQVARLVQRVVMDSGWLSRLEERGAEGLAQAANVYKAIRMVKSIEDTTASGASRTARLFQSMLERSKEAPGALSATGGDFVRIMTVHASKGLEFPIVAVGEFRSSSAGSSQLVANEVDGKVYCSLDLQNTVSNFGGMAKLGDLQSLYAGMTQGCVDEDELARAVERAEGALAQRAALVMRDAMGEDEEAKRLLYVALTRAKEALVVSLLGKSTKDNPFATPKSALGAVVRALAGPDGGFEPGISHFGFGGTADALVEHVVVERGEDASAGASDDSPDAEAADLQAIANLADGLGAPTQEEPFIVPEGERPVYFTRIPYTPSREGVFSYSSIAEASHEGDVLERLAAAAFISADAAEEGWELPGSARCVANSDGVSEGCSASAEESDEPIDFSLDRQAADRMAAVVDEDDGSWAYVGASCADSDKATDLGTAFHRLAQYAVAVRCDDGTLSVPPDGRIEVLAHAGNLDGAQRARLRQALGLWFESEIAHNMAAFADLRAEAPFFVKVPLRDDVRCAFLEGEIDLLGIDEAGARAVVVDYKTGGRADETEAQLRLKHVLQASCYAYAVMLQGISEVDAVFVRVERPRADDPSQPQCVRYHFTSADLPMLADAIAGVWDKGDR